MGYMTPGKHGEAWHDPHADDRPMSRRRRGLGDVLEDLFRWVGINWLVKKATRGKDCGCKRRRDKLNKAWAFRGPTDDL
jgi:hypothetical protein